jgi:hypothetical protein
MAKAISEFGDDSESIAQEWRELFGAETTPAPVLSVVP